MGVGTPFRTYNSYLLAMHRSCIDNARPYIADRSRIVFHDGEGIVLKWSTTFYKTLS